MAINRPVVINKFSFYFQRQNKGVTPKQRLIYKVIFRVPPPPPQEEQKPPEADFPQLLNQLHDVHVIQNSSFPFLISFLGHWYRNAPEEAAWHLPAAVSQLPHPLMLLLPSPG